MKKKFLEIGKIVSVHGLNGCVKVLGWCDDLYIFKKLCFLYLDEKGNKKLRIEKIIIKKNFVLIKLHEINSVEEAKKMVSKILYVKREDFNLKEDEIFVQDLIGMQILDYYKKEKCYGKIIDIIKTGANDVYVVKNDENRELLVPVIKDVIIKKDYYEEKIYIKPLKGLFDV